MLKEESFIRRMHDGDETAFKEIFEKFYQPLCLFAHAYVRDEKFVDDFVQDAFFNLWSRRKDFDMVATMKSYLYINVKNSCLNYLKHQEVHRRNEQKIKCLSLTPQEEIKITEASLHARLYQAILTLPEQSRKIVLMTLYGKSNVEIACELNISVNTVKTLKLKAYRNLRSILQDIRRSLILLLFC